MGQSIGIAVNGSAKLLIRGARQLLTLRGLASPRRGEALSDLGLIEDGALLIENGSITEVGQSRRVENLVSARSAQVIDANRRVVMPGFVDSHTHLVSVPPMMEEWEPRLGRGAAAHDISTVVDAVRRQPGPAVERSFSDRLHRMALHGTTTAEVKSGFGLDESTEMKLLRAIGRHDGPPVNVLATYLGAHTVPPEFDTRPNEYIDWLIGYMLPLVARRRMARFADIYCGSGGFTGEQVRRYLHSARELGFELKVHADEFEQTDGVRSAVEIGAISADHLEHTSDEEVELLAGSWTMATLLPAATFHLGLHRYAPARALIEAGAAVALASDFNMTSCPTYSMQTVIALACIQMHMRPAEAIAAATINGAWALGMADSVGTLEAGKRADLVVLDISDYRELGFLTGANAVEHVIKSGSVVH